MLWHNNGHVFTSRTGAHLVPPEPHFRWRGGEITRLEGFTDAVFAFAVTLLAVSLEVPHTFQELPMAMKGFFAFAICFDHSRAVCQPQQRKFVLVLTIWFSWRGTVLPPERLPTAKVNKNLSGHYAYRMRVKLELNEYETISTRNAIIHFAGLACVGVAVAIAALVLPSAYVGYAGFLFCLNGIWGWAAGSVLGKQQRLVLERMKARSASGA